MRKIIQTSIFLFVSAFAFGQSVTITPSQTSNDATTGNNVVITDNTANIGIYGRRFNGTLAAPTAVISGNELFSVSSSGQTGLGYSSSSSSIRFVATENWGLLSNGSKMSFWTIPNGGFSQSERMTINHDGKIGIGTPSPLGKLQINHSTNNSIDNPHLRLRTTNDASFGMIRMENNTTSRFFTQYFGVTSATAGNNFVSWDYNGTNAMLTLYGNGNAEVAGFTKLGSDASSPKIKMKELSGNSNTVLSHGFADLSKIISVSVLIEDALGALTPDGSQQTNFKYSYYVDLSGVHFQYLPSPESISVSNRPARVLITYKE
jgi:hypothetical protein